MQIFNDVVVVVFFLTNNKQNELTETRQRFGLDKSINN